MYRKTLFSDSEHSFGVFLTREDIITIGTRIGDTAIDPWRYAPIRLF